MNDRTKYMLIGIIIGIIIGMAVLYLLFMLRIVRPFGFSGYGFARNFTDYPRPPGEGP